VKTEDELGQLAATLNQTFERLQQAFQRERQFTADASHELRTPLAILQSETSLSLSKNRNPEEYRKSLELVSDEISRMTSMVNKLLVLARADNGAENLNLKAVSLNELLSDLASDMEALCEDKALHFELDLQDQLRVRGDEIKLRELFVNLLSNAIRYTPGGGRITVSLLRDSGNAKIAVADTGIGIPYEHLPHIFERFYRVNKSHSLEENGSGLGLAIAKHIAEQHGGIITVNSRARSGQHLHGGSAGGLEIFCNSGDFPGRAKKFIYRFSPDIPLISGTT
jgi:signal transduction histidine kinase